MNRSSARRAPLLVLVASLLATSCAVEGSALQIGFKRIALDLAFKDAALTPGLEAARIVRTIVPAPEVPLSEELLPPMVVRVVRVVPPPTVVACPAADPGQVPQRAAFAVVRKDPKPGLYRRRNDGKITIEAATRTFEVPIPATSTVEVSPTRRYTAVVATGQEVPAGSFPEGAGGVEPVAEVREFSLTRRLLPGRTVTDTFRFTNEQPSPLDVSPTANGPANGGRGTVTADYLYLVSRVTVNDGVESAFRPSPPIRYLRLNVAEGPVEQSGATHGGVDSRSQVAMTVTSQIESREVVDVCGEVLDTYRVRIQEQLVDLAKTPPEVSGNEGAAATYWNLQFDNGLLIVREQVDATVRTSTEVLGQRVPVVARYQYTSTLRSADPLPASGR